MYIGCLFEYSPQEKWPAQVAGPRLSSKQTIFCLGSNRNKLKRDLFRFYFGLFREIIKNKILVLFRCFETNRNKKSVFRNKPKLKINTVLCNGHGHWSGHDFLFRFEPKRTKLDLGLFRESKKKIQTEQKTAFQMNRNWRLITSFYVMDMGVDKDMISFILFGFFSNCLWVFRLKQNTKQAVSILKQNSRNKRLLRIVPKLVSVPVSLISKRNKLRRTP